MNELKELTPYEIKGQEIKTLVLEIQVHDKETHYNADKLLRSCNELEKEIENKRDEMVRPLNTVVKEINTRAKEVALPVNEAKLSIKQKILSYNEEIERIKRLELERVESIINGFSSYKNKESLEEYFLSLDSNDQNNSMIQSAWRRGLDKIEELEAQEIERQKRIEEDKRLEEIRQSQSLAQAQLEAEKLELERQKREITEAKERESAEAEAKMLEEESLLKMKQQSQSDKVKGIQTVTKWEIIDEDKVPRQVCSSDSKKINALIKLGYKNIDGIRIREEKIVK